MYDKIKLASTLDSLMFEFNSLFLELTRIIQTLENDSVELKKQHEQSLKKAYEKGYEEGVKYTYTDKLISDEKFPF